MTNKTFTRFVAIMTAAIVILFVGLVKVTYGSEILPEPKPNNPIINTVETVKDRAINNRVTQFVIDEKNEIVEFQKESWQQGKDQLANNKETISKFWKALKGAVRFYTTTQ